MNNNSEEEFLFDDENTEKQPININPLPNKNIEGEQSINNDYFSNEESIAKNNENIENEQSINNDYFSNEESIAKNNENMENEQLINDDQFLNEELELYNNYDIESEQKLNNDYFSNEESIVKNNEDIENEHSINSDSFINEEKELNDNKEKNIKYILIGGAAAIIVLLIIIFFPKVATLNKNTLEKQMKNSSKQYFDKYMSINDNTNEYIVTLDMLENANKQGEKYNLKGLEKCKKQTTLSKIIVDSKTRETKKIEVELNC